MNSKARTLADVEPREFVVEVTSSLGQGEVSRRLVPVTRVTKRHLVTAHGYYSRKTGRAVGPGAPEHSSHLQLLQAE